MTLDTKIGQMLLAGFPSKTYDEHLRTTIEEKKIGNILLFARNIGTKEEIIALTKDIQENMLKNIGVPGFIAVDQEGGTVTRIHGGATFFPGNMALAAANVEEGSLSQGEIVGEELKNLGVNLVLAPVLDVNNNPQNPLIGVRSYGDNPELVSHLGIQLIKGFQSSGVVATAKHFPGHGDTNVDSHLALPIVYHDLERLMKLELIPFKAAIEAGVGAIMTSHILFPALEKEKLPATLSYKIITELLRQKLGFKGLVITDCMEMKAIAENYGGEKASVLAIKAGADIICISHSLNTQLDCHGAIKQAVINGEISESRINESVKRILLAKNTCSLFTNSFPEENKVKNFNNSKANRVVARRISERSIVVTKDDKKLIPICGKGIFISTEAVVLTGVEYDLKKEVTFCKALKDKFGGEAFTIPLNPDNELIKNITKAAINADRVIIGIYNAGMNRGQIDLVNSIKAVNENIIVVALRSPYELTLFNEISTLLCTFEYNLLAVTSTLKILSGEIMPHGKLPINIL